MADRARGPGPAPCPDSLGLVGGLREQASAGTVQGMTGFKGLRRSLRRFFAVLFGLSLVCILGLGPWHGQAAPQAKLAAAKEPKQPDKSSDAALNCFPLDRLSKDRLSPPILKFGEPLDVEVKLHVDEIPLISSTDDQFQLEGFLDVAWCDPRLAADLTVGEGERVYANEGAIDYLKRIWTPQITFINEVGETVGDDFNLTIFNDGRAEIQRRFTVTLESNFDVHRFPFDRQTLEGEIASFAWDSRVVRLIDDGRNLSVSKAFGIPDWNVIGFASKVVAYDDPDHGNDVFSMLKLEIDVARKSDYYLYKIFIPLGVLSFTSIFFLAVPIDAIGDRIGFISGLLFTTLAYQLIIANSVPRVPYFTLGDSYTLFLFFFMVAEVFIAYGISLVDRFGGETKVLVNRVELGFEIMLPLLFVLVNVYFYAQARL